MELTCSWEKGIGGDLKRRRPYREDGTNTFLNILPFYFPFLLQSILCRAAEVVLLLLLLLSRFSRVRLCVTPETAAHQAPLSLGFSRQEHWSGLPFPSPEVVLDTCKSNHVILLLKSLNWFPMYLGVSLPSYNSPAMKSSQFLKQANIFPTSVPLPSPLPPHAWNRIAPVLA